MVSQAKTLATTQLNRAPESWEGLKEEGQLKHQNYQKGKLVIFGRNNVHDTYFCERYSILDDIQLNTQNCQKAVACSIPVWSDHTSNALRISPSTSLSDSRRVEGYLLILYVRSFTRHRLPWSAYLLCLLRTTCIASPSRPGMLRLERLSWPTYDRARFSLIFMEM